MEYDNWKIGLIDVIGTSTAGLKSESANGCPFHIPAEQWYYYDGYSSWISGEQNDITFECLQGKYY